jgi:hypothetical protein
VVTSNEWVRTTENEIKNPDEKVPATGTVFLTLCVTNGLDLNKTQTKEVGVHYVKTRVRRQGGLFKKRISQD